MRFGRRVRRTRRGDFEIRLPDVERELLHRVALDLRALLDDDPDREPTLRRLFPTAYPDDEARDAEYHDLVRRDLVAGRRAAVDVLDATADATRLDEEQLLAWMSVVNDVRLVLGTALDVSEETDLAVDPSDPEAPSLAVYGYLGFLLEQIVDALQRA